MLKDEILYNIILSGDVYQDPKVINWKRLGLKQRAWISDEKTDTQGFMAMRGKTLFIVWRGSSSQEDFIKDAQVRKVKFRKSGEKVHRGFLSAFESVRSQFQVELEKIQPDSLDGIFICGHSLGGALSTLSAYTLCNDFPNLAPLVKVVTVGSPRVGNMTFVSNYNKLVPYTLRLVNDRDIVARIPKIGYDHVNDGLIVDDKGKRVYRSLLNPVVHVSEVFISNLSGESVRDHGVKEYLKVFELWDGRL